MERKISNFIWEYTSPIGKLVLASDGECLTGLWLEGQKYFAAGLSDDYTKEQLPVFKQAKKWLDIYFEGEEPDFSLPLNPAGSPFRQLVWNVLCKIPYGQVMSYGEIARAVARELDKDTMSAQAVGGAVGHNPISIIIPCHRAVGADGSLTGYAGGLDNKIKLLELEHVNMKNLYLPKYGTAL